MTLQDEMFQLFNDIDNLLKRIEDIHNSKYFISKPTLADIGKLQLVREMLNKAVIYSDI